MPSQCLAANRYTAALKRRRGATLYTLYAANGRSIAWTSRSNDPLYIGADKPDGSDMQDSPQLAAAILALAKAHAGLIPRTFDIRAADRASNLASERNLPFRNKALPGLWHGSLTALFGVTLGAGLATLSMRSPVTPALAQVCFATLAVSTLWSLALTVRDAMQTPRFLMSAERPDWRLPTGFSAGGVAQLQQSRVRWRNWGMATRAALLLVGAIAGLAVIIMALAVGYIAVDLFDAWAYLSWLVGVAIFGGLRVRGQFSADRVAFLADAHGLRDLRSPASQPTPWPDIATLRFTWTRAAGYVFSASTQDGEEFSWVSQSRLWRDEPPDLAASGVQASAVDGDAFAAMVAAYTGLTPAQELG